MTTAAILGAGKVGTALATRLIAAGASVRFGVRDAAAKGGSVTVEGTSIPAMRANDAVRDADVVLLATPAAAAIAAATGADLTAGQVLVDCTNPVSWNAGPVWAPPAEGSVTAALAKALPHVRVVKAFNHFGTEVQTNPMLITGPADAFVASDDAEARRVVVELAGRMGFRAHDAGGLRNAAVLENLAILWIHLATVGGAGRTFGFRMEALA